MEKQATKSKGKSGSYALNKKAGIGNTPDMSVITNGYALYQAALSMLKKYLINYLQNPTEENLYLLTHPYEAMSLEAMPLVGYGSEQKPGSLSMNRQKPGMLESNLGSSYKPKAKQAYSGRGMQSSQQAYSQSPQRSSYALAA